MSDFTKLADLIDAFATANETFKATHMADYNSADCYDAYDRRDGALEALQDEIHTILRQNPRDLSAALRGSTSANAR